MCKDGMALTPVFATPVREIRSIEITSRCTRACPYCLHPQPGFRRPKQDMDEATWQATLAWVRYFCEVRHTQTEVNLSGVGEPLLHPRFVACVAELREVLGWHRQLLFTTNGDLVTLDLVRALQPYKPMVCVTAHDLVTAGPAARLLADAGLLRDVSIDPVVAFQNWAGQVPGANCAKRAPCLVLKGGAVTVTSTGAILACCNDATEESLIAHVSAPPYSGLMMRAWARCAECWQEVPR
jgi:hypothetical protein